MFDLVRLPQVRPSLRDFGNLAPTVLAVATIVVALVKLPPRVFDAAGSRGVVLAIVSLEALLLLVSLTVPPVAKQLFLQTYSRVGRADRSVFFGSAFWSLVLTGSSALVWTGWLAMQLSDSLLPDMFELRMGVVVLLLLLTVAAALRYVYSVLNTGPKELKTMQRVLMKALKDRDVSASGEQLETLERRAKEVIQSSSAIECSAQVNELLSSVSQMLGIVWGSWGDGADSVKIEGQLLVLVERIGIEVAKQHGKGKGRARPWVEEVLKSVIDKLTAIQLDAEKRLRSGSAESIAQSVQKLDGCLVAVQAGQAIRV